MIKKMKIKQSTGNNKNDWGEGGKTNLNRSGRAWGCDFSFLAKACSEATFFENWLHDMLYSALFLKPVFILAWTIILKYFFKT